MKCKCGRQATINIRYSKKIGEGIEPVCETCYYAKKEVGGINSEMHEVETTIGILKRR